MKENEELIFSKFAFVSYKAVLRVKLAGAAR
jgi:hypothetical protein